MADEYQSSFLDEKSGEGEERQFVARTQPLAARVRARSLDEIVGQEHILSEDALLPRLIRSDSFGSLILYGPPGCGKTTLAEVIANETKSNFVRINAVLSNVAEVRDILRMARYREDRTVLFIDEIHRFNKAQQDLLLPDVEAGNISLIGATTHNPGFYIIPPLLSRSHLFHLEPVPEDAIKNVLKRALRDTERGLGNTRCEADDSIFDLISRMSDGDLRRALNILETIVKSKSMASVITDSDVAAFAKERQIRYDANEDEHYDTASAFIKSIRGCDPDAAMYWLAKMLLGGEDPRFIARRLLISASEDIGLADSRAISLAMATFQACEVIGLPECELNLAHCTIFLAMAPKSNSATMALSTAKASVTDGPVQSVPLHLRDSHNKVGKQLGHGSEYLYSHEYAEAITGQEYMESPISIYSPVSAGAESAIAERLIRWKEIKRKIQNEK